MPQEPPFNPVELDITAAIGNGLTNKPEDVIGISKALGRLGLFTFDKTKEPSPIISHRLVEGIRDFQRDHEFSVTGEIKPGDGAHVLLMAEAAEQTRETASGSTSSTGSAPKIRKDGSDSKIAGPSSDPSTQDPSADMLEKPEDFFSDQLERLFETFEFPNVTIRLDRKKPSEKRREEPKSATGFTIFNNGSSVESGHEVVLKQTRTPEGARHNGDDGHHPGKPMERINVTD